jgi:hypothetical protein
MKTYYIDLQNDKKVQDSTIHLCSCMSRNSLNQVTAFQ